MSLREHLEERALLLDDEDLLEPARELADDARLHREQHAHLEDADAVAAQCRRRPARARRAPGARRSRSCRAVTMPSHAFGVAHRDPVELVLPRVAPGQLEARDVKRALHVEAVGRDQVQVDLVLEGLAVELDRGMTGSIRSGADLGGARLVGDVRDDLDAHPEAGRAREHEAVQAEIEDLLHVARVERRHQGVVERDLGVTRQGRRLGHGDRRRRAPARRRSCPRPRSWRA